MQTTAGLQWKILNFDPKKVQSSSCHCRWVQQGCRPPGPIFPGEIPLLPFQTRAPDTPKLIFANMIRMMTKKVVKAKFHQWYQHSDKKLVVKVRFIKIIRTGMKKMSLTKLWRFIPWRNAGSRFCRSSSTVSPLISWEKKGKVNFHLRLTTCNSCATFF